MKNFRKLLIVFLTITTCLMFGCDKKVFTQSSLTRDIYNTGGNLTYFYDEQSKVAYFGEEGEVVQYYEEDIAKGWNTSGCRIGFALTLPKELKDYKSASAKINNKELNSADFIVKVNEDLVIAQFQPLVSENNRILNVKISWTEDSTPQQYKVIIKEGTLFMPAN